MVTHEYDADITAGVVVQPVNLPLVVPTSHITMLVVILAAPLLIQFSGNVSRGTITRGPPGTWVFATVWDTMMYSWLLAWSGPDCYAMNQQVKRSLYPSLSVTLSLKSLNQSFRKCRHAKTFGSNQP